MEEYRTPFGQRLFAAREAAGLTQEQAAKKVGMAQSTLAEAELSGKRSGYVPQLADLYRVPAGWLATGKGDFNLHRVVVSKERTDSDNKTTTKREENDQSDRVSEILANYKLPSARERIIEQINEIIKTIDDNGLSTVLYEAKKIAETFPIVKQTPASSA